MTWLPWERYLSGSILSCFYGTPKKLNQAANRFFGPDPGHYFFVDCPDIGLIVEFTGYTVNKPEK
jgi:hypothetical protein